MSSYLVLILTLKAVPGLPVNVTLKLDVDANKCEEVFVPKARKEYVNSSLNVISAKCFSTK